ncbi:HET-domain-containing protein [Apiospora phragmitis]|uniref:HET-domain-containing protein n=1 Tax=Apiospora phragmitis TaxID=2905665 RepID=A0ABR1WW31_9PEZI
MINETNLTESSGGITVPITYSDLKNGTYVKTRTTKKTLHSYLKEGIGMRKLPQTLVDAVRVCRRLDIPYLWVDALCIVQDDSEDLKRELLIMPEIYQQGYLTIFASRADSVHDGFLDEKAYTYHKFPLQSSPSTFFDLCCSNGYRSKDGRTGHALLLENDLVVTRRLLSTPNHEWAWMFQEALLSPRKLCYSKNIMHWYCRSAQKFDGNWKKDKLYDHDRSTKLMDHADAPIPCVPGRPMPALEPIVQHYSNRAVTNSSDKLTALSAITKTIADCTGYTYLAGLFKENLPLQLCWVADEGRPKPRPKQYRAPSWSRAAVDASIRFMGNWWTRMGTETQDGRFGTVQGWDDEADGIVDVLSAHVMPTSPGTECFSIQSGLLELRGALRRIEHEVNLGDGTGQTVLDGCDVRCMADAWEDDWPSQESIFFDDPPAAESSTTADAAAAALLGKNVAVGPDDEDAYYKRIGSCRWSNLERHMFDCKAADLPGWDVQTITVI